MGQTDGRITVSLNAFPPRAAKGNVSPYLITERRVPELIPVLGSQPANEVSHKPDGKLPLHSCEACSYPRNP